MAAQHAEPERVFLNIPYDAKFERLYLAYIVGVIELGLKSRATLAIPGGKHSMALEQIPNAVEALGKGDNTAWKTLFTSEAEMSDDGSPRSLQQFTDSALGHERFTNIEK